MKKRWIFAALVAIFALAMFGCKTEAEDDPPPPPKKVNSVTITVPAAATVTAEQGSSTLEFTAVVSVANGAPNTLKWEVTGTGKKAGTTIAANQSNNLKATLTIAADEDGPLTVTATSTFDTTKSDTKTVTVVAAGTKTVDSIDVTTAGNATSLAKGTTLQFSAKVNGLNLDDTETLTWSITAPTAPATGTTISIGGLLTVDEDETATSITVEVVTDVTDYEDVVGTKTVAVAGVALKITFLSYEGYTGGDDPVYLMADGQTINAAFGITSLPSGADRTDYEFWGWYDGDDEVTVESSFIADTTVRGFYRSTTLTNDATATEYVEEVHLSNAGKAIYKFILPKGAKYDDYEKISVKYKVSEAHGQHNANTRLYGLFLGIEKKSNGASVVESLTDVNSVSVKVGDYNTINAGAYLINRQENWANTQFHAADHSDWFTVEYNLDCTPSRNANSEGNRPASMTGRTGTFFYAALGLGGQGRPMASNDDFNKYNKDRGVTQLIKDVTLVPKSTSSAAPVIAYGSGNDWADFASYIEPAVDTSGYPSTRKVLSGSTLVPATITCACNGCALEGETLESATWGNIFCSCDADSDGVVGDCPNNCELCERIGPPKCVCPNGTVHLEECACAAFTFNTDCECTIAKCACATEAGGSACALHGKEFSEVAAGTYCTCDNFCPTACQVCRAVGPEPATVEFDLLASDSTVKGVKFNAPSGNWASFADLNTAVNALLTTAKIDIRKYDTYTIAAKFYKSGTEVTHTNGAEIFQVVISFSIAGSINGYDLNGDYNGTVGDPPKSPHDNGTVNHPVPSNVVGNISVNFQTRGNGTTVADQVEITAILFKVAQ